MNKRLEEKEKIQERKKERLAQALRENLHKRKAQMRGRKEKKEPSPEKT